MNTTQASLHRAWVRTLVVPVLLVVTAASSGTAQPPATTASTAEQRPWTVESVLDALAEPLERSNALAAIPPALQRNPRVRSLLIEELQRANTVAVERMQRPDVGARSADESLLRLIEMVSELRDPLAIPVLVSSLDSTDMACRAIAGFGSDGVRGLLSDWDDTRAGGRLSCLALMAERNILSTSQRDAAVTRARSTLEAPRNLLGLAGGIDLAMALGERELIQHVEVIAANENAALRGGVETPGHAAFMQRYANRVLGRTVSIVAALDVLEHGTLTERLDLVLDIETTPVLRTDQRVRTLLVEELERVNAARLIALAQSSSLNGDVEQYRGRLAAALARLRVRGAVRPLAGAADASTAVGSALAEFGNVAVPEMVAVWNTRNELPYETLKPLWLALLRGFTAIALDSSTSNASRTVLMPVVRNALAEPPDAWALMAAVDLALLLGTPEFTAEVMEIAGDRQVALERGIEGLDALRVAEYATQQLAVPR